MIAKIKHHFRAIWEGAKWLGNFIKIMAAIMAVVMVLAWPILALLSGLYKLITPSTFGVTLFLWLLLIMWLIGEHQL